MSMPPSGWYPDPAGGPGKRYWNGTSWTTHVTPPPVSADEPPAPGSTAPTNPSDSLDNGADRQSDDSAVPGSPGAQAPEPPVGGAHPPATPTEPPPGATGQPAPWPGSQPGTTPQYGTGNPPPTGGPGTTPYGWAPAAPVASGYGAGDPRVVWGPDGQMLSGWWRRVGGYLIDTIGIAILTMIVVIIVGALTGSFSDLFNQDKLNELIDRAESTPGYQPSLEEFVDLFGSGFVTLFIVALIVSLILGILNGVVLVARSGQTVGDRVVSIRKVTQGRQPPSMGAAFLRWLIPNGLGWLGNIPFLGIAFSMAVLLDYLWPLWDSQNRTWQDMAAKTWVERADVAGPMPNSSSPYPNN